MPTYIVGDIHVSDLLPIKLICRARWRRLRTLQKACRTTPRGESLVYRLNRGFTLFRSRAACSRGRRRHSFRRGAEQGGST
jgi:hypothetical protein